jgi:hypothetical protein
MHIGTPEVSPLSVELESRLMVFYCCYDTQDQTNIWYCMTDIFYIFREKSIIFGKSRAMHR